MDNSVQITDYYTLFLSILCLQTEADMLYLALIDNMKMADTVIPCSQFNSIFRILQIVNSKYGKCQMEGQYQVLLLCLPTY